MDYKQSKIESIATCLPYKSKNKLQFTIAKRMALDYVVK